MLHSEKDEGDAPDSKRRKLANLASQVSIPKTYVLAMRNVSIHILLKKVVLIFDVQKPRSLCNILNHHEQGIASLIKVASNNKIAASRSIIKSKNCVISIVAGKGIGKTTTALSFCDKLKTTKVSIV